MNPRDRDMVDLERSTRSVFVGNIPYEATEDQLKDIFSEVGPVISFRLVFDRESGKPKGYGFAEYQDQETAMSAMRNLNSRELHGRALRVDHATSERNRILDDINAMGPIGPPQESPYGEPVAPRDAPEAISKAVASLPPEQMFELMKQMKQCIQNNPVEARNMLLQNPQLAYALLQAQVVMRIVDPEIAMKMLHRQNPVPTLLPPQGPPELHDVRPNGDPAEKMGMRMEPMDVLPPRMEPGPMDLPRRRDGSPMGRFEPRGPMDRRIPPGRMSAEERLMDLARGDKLGGPRDFPPMERGRGPPMGMRDPMRRSPERFGRGPFGRPDPRDPGFGDMGPGPRDGMGVPPGLRGPPMDDRGGPVVDDRRPPPPHGGDMDRNEGAPMERGGSDPRRIGQVRPTGPPANEPARPQGPGPSRAPDAGNPDQEKAALIMQVLQLTPEQISMLPEEQRKSILILKEQITGGRA